MFGIGFTDSLILGGVFVVAYLFGLLANALFSLAYMWVDDWERPFKNHLYRLSDHWDGCLRDYYSRGPSEDNKVKSVTGTSTSRDRDLSDRQREKLVEKYPELFKTNLFPLVFVAVAITPPAIYGIVYFWQASIAVGSLIAVAYTARFARRLSKAYKKHLRDYHEEQPEAEES